MIKDFEVHVSNGHFENKVMKELEDETEKLMNWMRY